MHEGAGSQEFGATPPQVTVNGPPTYPAPQLYVTDAASACLVSAQVPVASAQVRPPVAGYWVVGASSQLAVGRGRVHHSVLKSINDS